MSEWSRVKSLLGGHKALSTIASATTLAVPEVNNAFYVSGSTTITSLTTPNYCRNREVTFIGATSASVTFTNTTGSTTAGQMDLAGESIVLSAKDILTLFCNENGVWQLVNYKQNNAVSTTVASASTITLPSTGDTFVLTGTTDVNLINAAASTRFRRIYLVGGTGASFNLVNQNTPTSGQMYLSGTNRQMLLDKIVCLMLMSDGTWNMISTTTT